MSIQGHLYFHSPCFDGIVSAVLIWDYLENREGWDQISLHPVNYHLREEWLVSHLEEPSAVVDFLFHPQAAFWADHHLTTFLTEQARENFETRRGPALVYDPRAGSCAGLLWRHLADELGYHNLRYEQLVPWAEKTDSARYDSVQEAILSSSPALQISASLALADREGYCEFLVDALRRMTLDEVVNLSEVRRRYEEVQALTGAGLARFEQKVRVEDSEIVVFDVDSKGVIVNRYAPYYFFPNARYSAGIVRWEDGAKITAMRNPWREFESVQLGRIFEQFGGGGHQRVGSVVLKGARIAEATALLDRLVAQIKREERFSRKELKP
jgi:hypothetical protein